jgi:very-short-patch-repair endonuclease
MLERILESNGEHRTCLEKQMHGYLTELGFVNRVDFYEQYPSGRYILDFAFVISRNPFKGVDLEVDGAKWHNSPEQRRRDGFRTHTLKQKGWTVLRFGETFTIEQVKEALVCNGILPSS